MGFGSSLLTELARARAGYGQGQFEGQQVALQRALQTMQMQRQMQNDAVANALKTMQGSLAGARIAKLQEPTYHPTDPNSAATLAAKQKNAEDLARLTASLRPAPLDPIKVHQANRDYDVKHPLPVQPNFTFPTMTDAQGNQHIAAGNTKTGQLTDTGMGARSGVGQGSASAQTQQARMLAAVSEARLADQRMRAFEDKLLSNTSQISPLQQAGGHLMTNLTDTKSPFGALMQAGSELALNKNSPEYAQYLRDAATIGRAEQMISPRGGNETMVRANALLSRAGTGAARETIEASRMARQALFGEAGGIAQALTPEQSTKLKTGLTKIKAGETGAAPVQPAPAKVPSFEEWLAKRKPPGEDEE